MTEENVGPNSADIILPITESKNVIEAHQALWDALIGRLQQVHNDWKQHHNQGKISWKEIIDAWDDSIRLAPGIIDFKKKWWLGSLFNGQQFSLEEIDNVIAPDKGWGKDFTGERGNLTIEESLIDYPKLLSLKTKRGEKDERWLVYFIPDSTPFAINQADADYVGVTLKDPSAISKIKEAFGEEAVYSLSAIEMDRLTYAILHTPGEIGSY